MILSFIRTFGKCLLAVFLVRHSALHFDSRETHKVFKTSNSFLLLGKGRCENEETAAKIMFQVQKYWYIMALVETELRSSPYSII